MSGGEAGGWIARHLAEVERRLAAACDAAGRARSEVTLVAVSKRHPAASVLAAYRAGQRIFGENQVQEGVTKAAELADARLAGLEWHLIGPIQSNKVRQAVESFDVLHAIDRDKIARRVGRECLSQERRVRCFVQVKIGDEDSKHGFTPGRFEEDVRPLRTIEGLDIVGLMAIPPWEEDPEDARRWFRQLRVLRDQASSWPEWSGFEGLLSMGMSDDFEIAIAEGATHIRVGTDIFGARSG